MFYAAFKTYSNRLYNMYSYTYLRTFFFPHTVTFFNLNSHFNAFLLKEVFLDSEQVGEGISFKMVSFFY